MPEKMGKEYQIEWKKPESYNASNVLRKLPSPINSQMTEIYNYSVEEYGFYFVDNLVDQTVAGYALKLFVDEALAFSESVKITEL